ncbi:MAG: tRNA (N6-threonylcarbamoyladenosine(37)-N6)-methyltransferase TrmO [Thiotrichaceae bacterium]|nr:tRNA (N6-threonylcarbamoyladenosine(37)-N6)-methyltransferase TrmO [Thiotrichaceae bacterium]
MEISAIGKIHSCFTDKFGTPRQPNLVPLAQAELRLYPDYSSIEIVRGLETFSHLWLIFKFHQTESQGWKPLVRPPRLGGNQRIGVFASRSMYRPNGLGLSVCKLERVEQQKKQITLHLSGIDLIDGTPIIDIKPYLPYSDYIDSAIAGYAPNTPETNITVQYTNNATQQCAEQQASHPAQLAELITQILLQDPRPAFHQHNETARIYGMKLYQLNIQWTYNNQQITVLSIEA